MVQSVLETLQDKRITKRQTLDKMRQELYSDIDKYSKFINTLESDPIEEMNKYIKSGKYKLAIADLIIPILSKVLNICIVILQKDRNNGTYRVTNKDLHIFKPENDFKETVYLEYTGNHYNTLVRSDVNDRSARTERSKEQSVQLKRQVKLTEKMEESSSQILKEYRKNEADGISTSKVHETDKDKLNYRRANRKPVYCVCREPDDGTRMVGCNGCGEWYHIRCIELTERDVQDMNKRKEEYYCEQCSWNESSKKYLVKQNLNQKYLSMKENLNKKISTLNDELKWLKRKEQTRRENEIQEKNHLKQRISRLAQDLKDKNGELLKQKKFLQEKENIIKSFQKEQERASKEQEKMTGSISEKEFGKQKKDLSEFKKENKQLKEELEKTKKRLALIQNEDDEIEEEKEGDTESINKEEESKKLISRLKRQIKKKELELEDIREEKLKFLKENLEQTRTIRNLNDSLELLKKTAIDYEVERAKSTKTSVKGSDSREDTTKNMHHCDSIKERYQLLPSEYYVDSEDEYFYHESDDDEDMDDEKSMYGSPKTQQKMIKNKNPNTRKDGQNEYEHIDQWQGDKSDILKGDTRPVCYYYQKGNCRFTKEKCWYKHENKGLNRSNNDKAGVRDERNNNEKRPKKSIRKLNIECKFFQNEGCKYGNECRFRHNEKSNYDSKEYVNQQEQLGEEEELEDTMILNGSQDLDDLEERLSFLEQDIKKIRRQKAGRI